MATFEYSSHPMAVNDFTLYPYQEQQEQQPQDSWNQEEQQISYSTYQDPNYITSSTFDSYQAQPAYITPEHFSYPYKNSLQAPTPSYSPSNSASHSFDHQNPPVLSAPSDSGASVQSTISSAMGSPAMQPLPPNEWAQSQHLSMLPSIFQEESATFSNGFDYETIPVTSKGCVDPALIQPYSPAQYTGAQFPDAHHAPSTQPLPYQQQPSPVPSRNSIRSPRPANGKVANSVSPYMRTQSWQPYPQYSHSRRPSVSSVHSKHSQNSHSSDDSNKGLCPIPTCGRHVKDLKAHMLTHQNERPEKCPIPTCEYHIKGFARKYDKNRHTLTHYKGTMVCGFCPGSGSAAEKSFNRADVFKRHLTSVHGVEQTPPNARRKSPASAAKKPFTGRDMSGMCSTCNVTFASAQDFYEHLDDCVLRVVQQADPSEAINEKLLGSMADNKQVLETMERNHLPTTVDYNAPTSFDQEDEADENDEADEDDTNDGTYGNRANKAGKSRKNEGVAGRPKKGLTHSKNGVPLAGPLTAAKGSKRRKNYPLSWGAAPENMRMRKRVLCVYDGQRRLWKDDMMLDADHEVRIPIPDLENPQRRAWVTDLDVQTLRRAEGLLNATEEEKGPWIEDDELENLMQ